MDAEQLLAVVRWARSLSDLARQQGLVLPSLPESSSLADLVTWAKALETAVGPFIALPPVPSAQDPAAFLAWARSVDTMARGFGISLPSLPS